MQAPDEHRRETISALLLAGTSTVFYSFTVLMVWSLSHRSGRSSHNQHWLGGNRTAHHEVLLYEPLDAVTILLFQCVLEGLFMSSAVGVPTLLAYLARKAEDERAKEREQAQERAALTQILTAAGVFDDPGTASGSSPALPRGPGGRKESMETITSADLHGIVVNDAWCDVEDGESIDSIDIPDDPPRRGVTFNRIVVYDPPPPPPIPLNEVTSRLKYTTRPKVVAAMHAHITASLLIATVAARQIQAERERTPMPIPLPRRRAALLCMLHGVVRALASGALYMGITTTLSLVDCIVLVSSAPLFSTLYRCVCLGESFSWQHIPGSFLVVASCGLVAMTQEAEVSFFTPLGLVVFGGVGSALAAQLHNQLRMQVHPYFIAVSTTLVGGVVCGVLHLASGRDGPSGAQWGELMFLAVLALIADSLAASADVEKIDVPTGLAKSLLIALPMGLQTVAIGPLTSSSSLAAVLAFTASVFLEVSRMSTSSNASYTQLIFEQDPFPPLPELPHLQPDRARYGGGGALGTGTGTHGDVGHRGPSAGGADLCGSGAVETTDKNSASPPTTASPLPAGGGPDDPGTGADTPNGSSGSLPARAPSPRPSPRRERRRHTQYESEL